MYEISRLCDGVFLEDRFSRRENAEVIARMVGYLTYLTNSGYKDGVTAPEGAGSLRRIRPQRSLWNVYDDHGLVGHDHHADAVGPATDDDPRRDSNTSYRDGSGCAEKLRGHGALGLPAYRQFSTCCDRILKLPSTIKVIINGTGVDGARIHNEQSSFNFGMSHLNHGDCSPLFLYQYRQASTAWERLAKTFSSIIVSIQSRRSCSMVTLIRGLFSTI